MNGADKIGNDDKIKRFDEFDGLVKYDHDNFFFTKKDRHNQTHSKPDYGFCNLRNYRICHVAWWLIHQFGIIVCNAYLSHAVINQILKPFENATAILQTNSVLNALMMYCIFDLLVQSFALKFEIWDLKIEIRLHSYDDSLCIID
uniref:Uncharacterized protein n=1 Tax=Rhizophagus irregularis (strain DAOM 181602 / DAOM 197198 / MUCL 43194) TaxID=747089 RepID=U9TXS9_RHIID